MSHQYDITRPEIAKAIKLAQELVSHCQKHNLNESTELYGVAISASYVKEKAYVEGKKYEKNRIATLLGLI